MDDTPDLIEEQAKLISRSKTLAELTPGITKWFGDLNSYVRVMFNDKAELLRVLREAEAHFTTIEQYLSDIERFPEITGVNFLDFKVLHDEILDDPGSIKAKLGIEKSSKYFNELYPFLDSIFKTQFADVSGNFQNDLKKRILENLDIFRVYLTPLYRSNLAFKSYIVYPYFVIVLTSLLNDVFQLLSALELESWEKLSDAKKAALKDAREKSLKAKEQFQLSSAAGIFGGGGGSANGSPAEDPLDQFLNKNPSLRSAATIYSNSNAAVDSEKVLNDLLTEVPPDLHDQFRDYFNANQQKSLKQLNELTKGKTPTLDNPNPVDSESTAAHSRTKDQAARTFADFQASLQKQGFSQASFNRVMFVSHDENKARTAELQKALQEAAEGSQAQTDLLNAYAEQNAVTRIQRAVLEEQVKAKQTWLQKLRIAMGREQQEEIDTSTSLVEQLGFQTEDQEKTSAQSFQGEAPEVTRKRLEKTSQNLSRLQTLVKSPVFWGGIGLTGAGGAALAQGIATASQPLIIGGSTLAGVGAGMSSGFVIGLVGGPIGAFGGAVIGGAAGFVSGLAINSSVQASLQANVPFFGSKTLETAKALGQQGASAAANIAPQTISNASQAAAGITQTGQGIASQALGNATAYTKAFVGAMSGTGAGVGAGAVTAYVAAPIGAGALLTGVVWMTISSAMLVPGGGSIDAGATAPLEISKSATPAMNVLSGVPVTYTLVAKNNTPDTVKDIVITDTLDILLTSIAIKDAGGASCAVADHTITCTIASIDTTKSVTITYTATTDSDPTKVKPDGKTPIKNTAKITGKQDPNGDELMDETTFTLNSDGAAIAAKSIEITNGLVRAWWGYYNYHPSALPASAPKRDRMDRTRWQTASGYNVDQYPGCKCQDTSCTDSCPNASGGAPNLLFWCTWNVIYSYYESNRPIVNPSTPGNYTGVTEMRGHFKSESNKEYVDGMSGISVSSFRVGDVVFLGKYIPAVGHSDDDAHVAILSKIDSTYIETSDSNNYTKIARYTIGTDGKVEPRTYKDSNDNTVSIRINGLGRLR